MKILVQNLQKRFHLGSDLIDREEPDVMLAQELFPWTERRDFVTHLAYFGCGTGLYYAKGRDKVENPRQVDAPHAEVGGFVWKKTIVATIEGIDFVSMHAYNGFPFKSIAKLLDHVRAVIKVLSSSGPAVFAGDFNTWSEEHLRAVQEVLGELGFRLVFSWTYPSRPNLTLDHVFVRDVHASAFSIVHSPSDHAGCLFRIEVRS